MSYYRSWLGEKFFRKIARIFKHRGCCIPDASCRFNMYSFFRLGRWKTCYWWQNLHFSQQSNLKSFLICLLDFRFTFFNLINMVNMINREHFWSTIRINSQNLLLRDKFSFVPFFLQVWYQIWRLRSFHLKNRPKTRNIIFIFT